MRHSMFEDISSAIITTVIDEWVRGRHAERNRCILKDRLLLGRTFENLAENYDMSVRQIKNIVYKYEAIICDKIEASKV